MKIFLVDDSPLICERLSTLFAAIPYTQVIGMAATPEAALAGVADSRPHVVIVDMHLRDGSGLTVLRRMPALDHPVVPIVLTNHTGSRVRQACMHAGAQFFFDKSTEFGNVCAVLRTMAANLFAAPGEQLS